MAAPNNFAALAALAGVPFREYAAGNSVTWELILTFKGEDFTADDFAVELFTLPDDRLPPIEMTVEAPVPDGDDTIVSASLDWTALDPLLLAAEPGREIVLWGRVHRTPDGGSAELWMYFKLIRLGN